jgi:hypothetical protein
MKIVERLLSVSTRTKILIFFTALMVSLGVLLLLAVRKTVVPSLHQLYHDKGHVLATTLAAQAAHPLATRNRTWLRHLN